MSATSLSQPPVGHAAVIHSGKLLRFHVQRSGIVLGLRSRSRLDFQVPGEEHWDAGALIYDLKPIIEGAKYVASHIPA